MMDSFDQSKFENAVALEADKCKGCINCIKRCPTSAIRVRNGKAVITKEFCIDCGECIRICPNHAKKATYDSLGNMAKYKYKVALPAPALYGQFRNIEDLNAIPTALKLMGFDYIYDVAQAAEAISAATRKYVSEHTEQWPIISTACPSVVKLVRVRFPNLIDHLLPLVAPVELAARIARKNAMDMTGFRSRDIGIFFISPCPAKVSACRNPITTDHCDVDEIVGIEKVYPLMLKYMKEAAQNPENMVKFSSLGLNWGRIGGESEGLLNYETLAADGIENCLRVLEAIDNRVFSAKIAFVELNACSAGCVGGAMTVENPYLAKTRLLRMGRVLLNDYDFDKSAPITEITEEDLYQTKKLEYEAVFSLGEDIRDNIQKMSLLEEVLEELPGIDCGSCGAPTCRALAEDIVRGKAKESDCIQILREYIHRLSGEIKKIDR